MPTIEELAAELETLRQRVDATESVLAIQSLKARYGELVDERFHRGAVVDPAQLESIANRAAGLFTVDGTWDGGPGLGVASGRAAIAARLQQSTLTFSRHFFVKPLIRVDGDSATARWDLLSPCRRADGTSFWMSGYEDDEYRRVDGSWFHHSMRLTTVFMSPVGEGWSRILT